MERLEKWAMQPNQYDLTHQKTWLTNANVILSQDFRLATTIGSGTGLKFLPKTWPNPQNLTQHRKIEK